MLDREKELEVQERKLVEEILACLHVAMTPGDTDLSVEDVVQQIATRLLSAEAAGQRQYEENVELIKKQAALEARVKIIRLHAVLRALDLPTVDKEKV